MTKERKRAIKKLYKVREKYHKLMACGQLDVYEQMDYMLYIAYLEEQVYGIEEEEY